MAETWVSALSSEQEPASSEEATVMSDNETRAMFLEEKDELPDFPLLMGAHGSDGGPSLMDIYGPEAKPELAPPPLLGLLETSPLDAQDDYAPSVMEEVAKSDDLLSLRDAMGRTALHIAAGRGATRLTKILLEGREVDVDAKDRAGLTPLMVAVANADAAAAEALIHAGADVIARSNAWQNPVHVACDKGAPGLLQLLLKIFPRDEVDAAEEKGRTALFIAALRGSSECAAQLLAAEADQSVPDQDGHTPLHAASQEGHLDVVRLLLARGPQLPDAPDKEGLTPLMAACAIGHVDVAKALLGAGADVEVTCEPEGYAAIHWAAQNGSVAMVKELIDRGSPVNPPSYGNSCLQVACQNGHLEVASVLVEKGADAYHINSEGSNAFSHAAQEGHKDILEFLLSLPCSDEDARRRQRCCGEALQRAALNNQLSIVETLVDSAAVAPDYASTDTEPKGNQALHSAAQAGHVTLVEYLLSKGANPNATNEQGVSPLMFAAMKGHVECVWVLLESGASVALLTPKGTALHAAAQYGQAEATALLLEHTPKHLLESRSTCGSTVLHSASLGGHIGTFRLLNHYGASFQTRMEDGDSCLHLAAQEGHGDLVDLILQHEEGRELLDARGRGGSTALMRAAQSGHVELASRLLDYGADPSARAADGATALHLAAKSGSIELLQLLLLLDKVDLNERDNQGKTQIMLASVGGKAGAVRLLIEAGAEVDLIDKKGRTALHCAAEAKEGGLETAKLLIAAGASVHKADDNGWTCLHFAANKGNADIVGFLLAGGQLSPNSKTNYHSTPLSLAADMGHLETVAVLLSFGADPDMRDKDGDCAKDCAVDSRHAGVVRVLERNAEEANAGVSGEQLNVHSWLRHLPE